jgi:hypothetical protein
MAENPKMDAAAEQAKKELVKNLDNWSARALADWWDKWYGKAGHKRLAQALLEAAGK